VILNIKGEVERALAEDIGSGDITAKIIPTNLYGTAKLYGKEAALVCGQAWFTEVFNQVSPELKVKWLVAEASWQPNSCVWAECEGPLALMLTAERTAINYLQTLSGVATKTYHFSQLLKGSKTKLLDTRKTIPGLRLAQKYAVRCGGGYNHRMGLYDEFLIKENHIEALGGINAAVHAVKNTELNKPIVVEVRNVSEFLEAKALGISRIMLDNFSDEMIRQALALNTENPCPIEVSGGMNAERIKKLADFGVDFISVGGLTKSITAIDLSLLVD
jgi:nicotinate-nucleotide pyrophosphorylase (carboxylating)